MFVSLTRSRRLLRATITLGAAGLLCAALPPSSASASTSPTTRARLGTLLHTSAKVEYVKDPPADRAAYDHTDANHCRDRRPTLRAADQYAGVGDGQLGAAALEGQFISRPDAQAYGQGQYEYIVCDAHAHHALVHNSTSFVTYQGKTFLEWRVYVELPSSTTSYTFTQDYTNLVEVVEFIPAHHSLSTKRQREARTLAENLTVYEMQHDYNALVARG